jgi:predicted outer membrane lipoprotein
MTAELIVIFILAVLLASALAVIMELLVQATEPAENRRRR